MAAHNAGGQTGGVGLYDADAVHIDAQQFRRAHLGSQVQRHIVAPAAVNVLHAVDFPRAQGREAGAGRQHIVFQLAQGDILIGLASTGVHSNGFSLVRKVFDVEHAALDWHVPELGRTLGEALLEPTVIYVKPVLRCMEAADVKGVSHITGGGFFENIPRCLPEGLAAKIDKAAIKTPPIFAMLQSMGSIPERDMFNTFNMGVGMTVIVSPDDADKALAALDDAYVIGEIVESDERVILC